jgi:prevent-host-death family protein
MKGTRPPDGKVLLVEPSPDLLRRYAGALKKGGFETTGVVAGTKALSLVERETFDVILVDMSMPDLGGLTLLRQLRERDVASSVILVCDALSNRLAVQALEEGAFQCLVKPVDNESLLKSTKLAIRHFRKFRGLLQNIWRGDSPDTCVVPATEAKNEFGRILEMAMRDGTVVITKHEAAKAVLVSLDRVAALLRTDKSKLNRLSEEFDALLARMQTPRARAGMKAAFDATPDQLGKAAVAAARKRG